MSFLIKIKHFLAIYH